MTIVLNDNEKLVMTIENNDNFLYRHQEAKD